jgi:hypothetical protein
LQDAIPCDLVERITYVTSEDGRTRESLKALDHFFISEPNGVEAGGTHLIFCRR